MERVTRWCAEAGRTAGPAAIRAALEALGWDELLAARALLADPPPGRPLGPFALADLARGTPLDQAVEREREGRYPAVEGPADVEEAPPAGPAPKQRARGRAAMARRLVPVLRKKASGPAPEPPPAARPPLLDELLLPAGRNALERLIRRHGGRPAGLVAALAAAHRRADGLPIDRADLDRLLEHHDLLRVYLRRERDELLHAVRAAGGVLATAGTALGTDRDGLLAAASRLGVGPEVEALRAARRGELGARATLSERARLLVTEEAKLGDLGLLEAFEKDLRDRLPEHLRVLASSREPLTLALARSLSLEPDAVAALMKRLGLAVQAPRPRPSPPQDAPPRRDMPGRPSTGRPSTGRPSTGRPSTGRRDDRLRSVPRPAGGGASGGRPSGVRTASPRPSGPRRRPDASGGSRGGASGPRRPPR